MKKPFPPQIHDVRKVLDFQQQNLARFYIDIGVGKGENVGFEKLNHFLNLLDFQLLSQQVLSRAVGNFLNVNINNSLRTSAMVGFYISIGW